MRISTDGQKNSIRITNDQSQYWSDISKGFAEDAEQSALEARGYADAAAASVVEADNIVKHFDTHVVTKTDEFDKHTVVKQGEFDTHASVKQNDFDVNAANVTARFDNNYLEKTKDFNTNATNKTSAFNSNTTSKTNAFNNNATAKTAIIDSKIEQAELAETNANIWAEGSDVEVRSLGGEHSAKGWNGVVSQTATSGVSSINNSTKDGIDLLNRTATNIAKEKYNNSAKGYLTGEISTDEIMVNQLVDMKHSTFDKSKFTVVGTPTITDDGIASGFSNGNYIKINQVITANSYFTLKTKFTVNESVHQYILGGTYNPSNDTVPILLEIYPNVLKFVICLNDNGKNLVHTLGGDMPFIFKVGDVVSAELKRDKNNGYKAIFNVNGTNYTYSFDSSLNLIFDHKPIIGGMKTNYLGAVCKSSIDLKAFSISVDGKEVFSGNTTDIDIIKKDNFTKVGNPTISDDGITNPIDSRDNYVIIPNLGVPIGSFKFSCKFNTAPRGYLFGINVTEQKIPLQIYFNGRGDAQALIQFSSNDNLSVTFDYPLGDKWFYVEYSYDGVNKYYFKIFNITDNTLIKEHTWTSDKKIQDILGNIRLYTIKNENPAYNLNEFKVYMNGDLVYQPLLRIPYTKTKTGSKIVDAQYRNRVEDTKEYTGSALYYTLDEENRTCTLPMGELYGFIGAATIVREKQYADGWLIEYSNGFCMQGGNFSIASSTEYTLNFYSKFRDTKYIILRNTDNGNQENVWFRSVYFYNKTVSSAKTYCVANNQNDWVAYGFIR